MGCLFAGLLKEARHDVFLLDNHVERAVHITHHGLHITQARGDRAIPMCAGTAYTLAQPPDLIILCVKTYDTPSALDSALPLIGPDTTLLSMQNGVSALETLIRALPSGRICVGTTTQGATVIGPGHVFHAGGGLTWIGAYHERDWPQAQDLARMFCQAGIDACTERNVMSLLWSKLVINAAMGPVSALSCLPNGRLALEEPWAFMLRKAATEAAAVARAKGIALLYPDPVEAALTVCRQTENNRSSMLQDVLKGRRTEIDAITGVIVREADALGVPVPVSRDLLEKIHALSTAKILRP